MEYRNFGGQLFQRADASEDWVPATKAQVDQSGTVSARFVRKDGQDVDR